MSKTSLTQAQQYDLLALQSFVAVVDAGGFRRAADQLGISTAAISRRISTLEEALGAQLLRRTTRRVDLTDAGQRFYDDVLGVFDMLGEAEERLRTSRERAAGFMRVAAPLSFGMKKLAPLVPEFLRRHPQLKMQLLLEDRYADLMTEGIDVAVRIGTLADSTLVAKHIGPIERVFCASPAYLKRHGVPRQPADLSRHCCLQYSQRGPREDWGAAFGVPGETLRIEGSVIANNAEVLRECAVRDMGIAFLPVFVVEDAIADGSLRRVLAKSVAPPLGLYAVRASRRMTPARVRLFIDYLHQALGA